MKESSTERWLAGIVKKPTFPDWIIPCSPKVYPFFEPIYISHRTQLETLPTTEGPYTKPGSCTIGLRRLEQPSSSPEKDHRSARHLQDDDRLSSGQFLTSSGMHSLLQVFLAACGFVEIGFFCRNVVPYSRPIVKIYFALFIK